MIFLTETTEFKPIWDYIADYPKFDRPCGLLTMDGMIYKDTMTDVVLAVLSQVIEGRSITVIPPKL